MLDRTVCDIIDAVKGNVVINGPIPFPTKSEKFKDTDRKIVIHSRGMELEDVKDETIDILVKMQIPVGVDVVIKHGE